jgi:hypothetical protein
MYREMDTTYWLEQVEAEMVICVRPHLDRHAAPHEYMQGDC